MRDVAELDAKLSSIRLTEDHRVMYATDADNGLIVYDTSDPSFIKVIFQRASRDDLRDDEAFHGA